MRYELTVIVPGNVDEATATEQIDGVKKLLQDQKATVAAEQYSGRQALAYPINKQTHGYYGTFEFESDGAAVATVERELRLGGQMLRWLTIQAYKQPYTIAETPKLAEDARSAEELLRRQSGETAPKKARSAKTEVEAAESDDERQKKLDEALGKLLSEDEKTEE